MGLEGEEMERIEEMFGQIQGNMQAMDSKMDLIMKQMDNLKLENKQLKEQVVSQELKIKTLEREVRRKNLIIKGVQEGEREEVAETMEKVIEIIESMGVKLEPTRDIDEARRLGHPAKEKKRPILLKLTTEIKKREILMKTNKLRGTSVWIDEDYTRETQEERKQLMAPLKEAREKGHRAYLRHNKLIIDKETYVIKNSELIKSDEKQNQNYKKRTVSERSPEGKGLDEQLAKVTRISKN